MPVPFLFPSDGLFCLKHPNQIEAVEIKEAADELGPPELRCLVAMSL